MSKPVPALALAASLLLGALLATPEAAHADALRSGLQIRWGSPSISIFGGSRAREASCHERYEHERYERERREILERGRYGRYSRYEPEHHHHDRYRDHHYRR